MTDWKQKIETQIADLRRYSYQSDDPADEVRQLIDSMHNAAMQLEAQLDVVVAAELLTDSLRVVEEHDDRNLSNATKLARQNDALMRLKAALDKLREVLNG